MRHLLMKLKCDDYLTLVAASSIIRPGVAESGVETINLLSEIPREMLCDVVGKSGTELWRRANGIDESPVVPFQEQKTISLEHTFQKDTIDMNILQAKLSQMTESIAFQLRNQNKVAGCVVLKLRYSDGETYTVQRSTAYCNTDHICSMSRRNYLQSCLPPGCWFACSAYGSPI